MAQSFRLPYRYPRPGSKRPTPYEAFAEEGMRYRTYMKQVMLQTCPFCDHIFNSMRKENIDFGQVIKFSFSCDCCRYSGIIYLDMVELIFQTDEGLVQRFHGLIEQKLLTDNLLHF